MIKCALQTNTIQIKHNKLRIPTGGRLTSWLFTRHGGVEFGATEDKSIQWQGGGFEPGTSRLQVQRPTTRPLGYIHVQLTFKGIAQNCFVHPYWARFSHHKHTLMSACTYTTILIETKSPTLNLWFLTSFFFLVCSTIWLLYFTFLPFFGSFLFIFTFF